MGGKRVGVCAPHKTCFPYGTLCKFPRGINFSNHFFSLTFFLLKKPLPAAFALLSQFFSAVVLSKSFTNNCLLSLFICLLPCHRCSKFLGFKMAVMCVDWESTSPTTWSRPLGPTVVRSTGASMCIFRFVTVPWLLPLVILCLKSPKMLPDIASCTLGWQMRAKTSHILQLARSEAELVFWPTLLTIYNFFWIWTRVFAKNSGMF